MKIKKPQLRLGFFFTNSPKLIVLVNEMEYKNVTTTQRYLRFPIKMIKSDFPSLIPIIENMENIPKNVIRGTKGRGTLYSNVPKLLYSHRE